MPHQTRFTALLVEQTGDKQFSRRITERTVQELPPGDVLIRVRYSSLNYKDALSASGHPGVTRTFPHTPGIDAVGEVVSCADGTLAPGEPVIVTGFDLGMNTPGGFGQYIRVPAGWVLRLPSGLTPWESMAFGTAGLTAGLSVLKLQRGGIGPESGEILVTGATGGVGSLAVAILARAGYRVTAATGKSSEEPLLRSLGAEVVIPRSEVTANGDRPMLKERWAGVVDVVGGDTLAAAVKATRYGGVVTCCGLVGSTDLPLNVYPFILRGVSLLGVDSAQCPLALRSEVWQLLSGAWKPPRLAELVGETDLPGLEAHIVAMLEGKACGRTLVALD